MPIKKQINIAKKKRYRSFKKALKYTLAIAVPIILLFLHNHDFTKYTPVEAAAAWYDNSWDHRIEITVDYTKVDTSDQTDFPVYLDLSDLPTAFFSGVKSDGTDIVITSSDGTTKLSRELVSIDTGAEEGELWFKAPTLSSTVDTDFFIYYGNSSGTETNDTSTWSNSFLMVQHMNEDPSGTAPQIIDSTSNGIDGTSNGSMTDTDLVASQIGDGIDFDKVDDYFSLDETDEFSTEVFTVTAWLNWRDTGGQLNILDNRDDTNDGWTATINANIDRHAMRLNSQYKFSGGIGSTIGNWHYFSWDSTATTYTMKIDGDVKKTGTHSETIDETHEAFIGARTPGLPLDYYNGIIDEIRVSSVSRSSDWIDTEFNNQSSPGTFYSLGSEEDKPVSNSLPIATNASIDSDAASVNLTESTTTEVTCTATVSDADGFADITSVEAVLYRTGVGSGASDDDNNHYTLTGDSECVPSNGSGTTEDYTCDFDVSFIAEPTDTGTHSADDWTCLVTPSDAVGAGTTDSDDIEMNTLYALSVDSNIEYGSVTAGDDTGATNQTTQIFNQGNAAIDIDLSGSDMCTDYPTCVANTLGVAQQEYSTSSFTYGAGTDLSSSSVTIDLTIAKPTVAPSVSSSTLYWGIGVPVPQTPGVYTGANTVTAVGDT